VPPGGIPAGHTVVVRFVARGTTSGPVSASDNRGNAYTTDVDVFNAGVRTVVLSSRLSTGLLGNEAFTVSYPAASASSVALEEFANIATGVRVDSTGTGTGQSRSPCAAVTTANGPDLLFALSGNENVRPYAEASGWTALPEATTACGGGPRESDEPRRLPHRLGDRQLHLRADDLPGREVGRRARRLQARLTARGGSSRRAL